LTWPAALAIPASFDAPLKSLFMLGSTTAPWKRSQIWLSIDPSSQQAKQMQATMLLASGRIDELAANLGRDLAAEGPRMGDAILQLVRGLARYPDRMAVKPPVRGTDQAVPTACRRPPGARAGGDGRR
jgi:hypothetical protein